MNLDKRLREILQANTGYGSMSDGHVIAQIHEAFKEAGYSKFNIGEIMKGNSGLMTGQEFYERFEKEIKQLERNRTTYGHLYSTTEEMFEAARKAAGIK